MLNCNLISKYRSCLMGASAILIILCHAPAWVDLPVVVSSVLSRGGWGVDVFLFLSGLGLFYSLSSSSFDTIQLKHWYVKRFKRLIIPYSLSYVPICIFKGMFLGNSLLSILGDISTLSFWTRHRGAWFVALIIPLYLIAPIIYKLFRRASSDMNKFLIMISLVGLCVFLSLYNFEGVEYHGIIYNIQFALSRVPSFIFGMYAGYYVLNNYIFKHPLFWCIGISLFVCLLKSIIPSLTISCFMAIPTILIMILIFSKDIKSVNRVCNFMGAISLESYLFNVSLPFFIVNRQCVLGGIDIFCNNFVPYIMVALIGTLLSYLVHRLVIRIDSRKFNVR